MYRSIIHNIISYDLSVYLSMNLSICGRYHCGTIVSLLSTCSDVEEVPGLLFLYSCHLQSIGCCLSLSSHSFFIVPAFRCSANFIFPPSLHLSPFESLAFATSNILPAHYIVHHVESRLFSCRKFLSDCSLTDSHL